MVSGEMCIRDRIILFLPISISKLTRVSLVLADIFRPAAFIRTCIYELDAVAYVRFASVYREFKDVNTFMTELKKMLDTK